MREELAAHRVLSYRLLWMDDRPPEEHPVLALSAIATHDLPTVAGLWSGSDLRAQSELGLHPNIAAMEAGRERLGKRAAVSEGASVEETIVGAHGALARAPSRLIAASLEDALGLERRPNMPGTVTEWPNWSIPLPTPLENIVRHPLVDAVAAALSGKNEERP